MLWKVQAGVIGRRELSHWPAEGAQLSTLTAVDLIDLEAAGRN
jgi:hypothetical protein